MPEKAVNIYRESGRLTFHASGPDRDPAYMVVSDGRWTLSGDELDLVMRSGYTVRLTAGEAALGAKCGYFGLSVWYAFEDKPEGPGKGKRAKAWKGPR